MTSVVRKRKHTTLLPFAEADAMAARCLLLLSFVLITLAEPSPGRIPKVYNALITSNQNLEPSKAYPVYQPVLRSAAFPFPLQTVFYGDLPLTNSLLPPAIIPAVPVKGPNPKVETAPPAEVPKEQPSSEAPPSEASSPEPENKQETEAPAPPSTESPIPLNEFGLPPQVIPLGNFGSGYEFTQINTFPYSYPGLRFYDSYDPFLFNPYANFPLYRPLTNVLAPLPAISAAKEPPKPEPAPEGSDTPASPPPEPSDLNILNYSSKDPAIPNVPPPPLPQGGLKVDAE